jgi:hypothetical protein
MWASSDYTHSDSGTYVNTNRDLDSGIYSIDDEIVSRQVRTVQRQPKTVQRQPKMVLKVPASPVVCATPKAAVETVTTVPQPPIDMKIVLIFIIVVLVAALVMMASSYTKLIEQTLALAVGMVRSNTSS